MKKKLTISISILLFTLGTFFLEFALAEDNSTELYQGKNYLEINQTMYVKDLVILNPNIESVSYFDEFLNKHFGYVNIFGGIGSNFRIEKGRVYEISTSKNTTLNINQVP